MEKSEKINELTKALVEAQKKFKEPKRSKQAYNYMYAPMDEVRASVIEALSEHNLSVVQFPINREGMIGVETMLTHGSGQFIRSEFVTNVPKMDPQAVGSVITYYRRYALLAVLGLAPEDDDANSAMPDKKEAPQITNPGAWVVPFGKFKGQKLDEIPANELSSYRKFILSQGKELKGPAKTFVDLVGQLELS